MSPFIFRRTFFASAMLASLIVGGLMPTSALAYDEASTAAINVDAKNVALKGFDPVAYFTVHSPTLGNAAYSANHNGVTYHFSSQENLAKFNANPAYYAPQFGGFCAMGVALDKKFDGDPEAWKIVEGKLYLNVTKQVQKKWLEDLPGNINKAYQEWPAIKDKAPKTL
ncbi:YHS domain-containing (seleno)protein [Iodobacter fluviatilis]|uniref:YHS domain n=1 Tax=Iodobacter fluviatilis TaxID=537 RepID=A0A377QA97_9NEIS|nr:YHS domain-containing (seleno)protein [Iodobacter fluviatilis]TCU89411.1 YHS domain-containing protein [Iodobacter fluviatilis]STQ90781.1 YHS domain [Iodobacter fluviatilis]